MVGNTKRRLARAALGTLLSVAGVAGLGPDARAEGRFGPYDVRTLFVIGKNLDKNEVQYGIRLDKDCVPIGDEPVYAYWRVYEKNPEMTEDLNILDRTAYGIKDQRVEQRAASGSKLMMRLRATSDRSIAIYVRKDGDKCAADAMSYLSGTSAFLQRVHVQLTGPLSIDYIELRGLRADNRQPIVERTKP
jgi:hypothetical protein